FGNGGRVAGGISTAKTVDDACFVVDAPQGTTAVNLSSPNLAALVPGVRSGVCRIAPPWSAQTQLKVNVIYPPPLDFEISGVYQNLPGIPILADNTYLSAQVRPSLGRDLSTGSATVSLIPIGAMYEDRFNQLDLRLQKMFRVGQLRIKGMADLYNIGNSAYVFLRNNTYGPSWGRPLTISGGRLAKFGVQIDF